MLMRLAILAVALLLAACAGTPALTGDPRADLAALGRLAVDDLVAARADAEAHGDALSAACWGALATWVPTLRAAVPAGGTAGVASAIQAARNVRRGAEDGLPDAVKLGCGGFVVEEARLLARLVAMFAGAPLPR